MLKQQSHGWRNNMIISKHKKQETIPVNNSLLNVVTPIGLEFKRSSFFIGELMCKMYGVIKYPQEVPIGWLSKVNNISSSIVCQVFTPVDNAALIESISQTVRQKSGEAESTRDPLARQRALKSIEEGEQVMKQIDQNNETVGYMSNVIMTMGKNEKLFTSACRKTESILAGIHCRTRGLANLQIEALKTLSPYYVPETTIGNMLNRVTPESTYVGGFPFSSSSFSDGRGYYFAKDSSGGMVALDQWIRAGDRTNSNWVVMGVAGQGKSATTKHIISEEYARGTKVIVIDPEREYKDLTYLLEGDWIDVGGGSKGRINPLQIKPLPMDDDEESEDKESNDNLRLNPTGLGDLAMHLKTLDIFFSLYLQDLDDIQKALLKDTLIEIYRQKGIVWETKVQNMTNDMFPIMTDLYNELIKRSNNKSLSKHESVAYLTLSCLLKDIAEGSDQFMWNGFTTISTNSKFICLDTHNLQNASDEIKKTQYFNILTWAWEQMARDRNEKVLLVCDEAYLLIDPRVPQSLVFLRNAAKRARKYESGLMIISHSVVDFLDPAVKMYGQALLDLPCYKLLFGCDGQNLKELADLYNLTDAEKELLNAKRRAVALFVVGAKRLSIKFDLQHKLKYISGGGR